MTPTLTLRRVESDDADRLRELNEVALRGVDAYAEGAFDEDLAAPREHYVEAGGEFLVGTVDDEVVAMGALAPVDAETAAGVLVDADEGPAVEVTRMRVAPDHQRRGYGSRLLAALEERARELEFEVSVLDTTARQTGAQRLYESFGYEPRGWFEWREYELLLYRKALAADA